MAQQNDAESAQQAHVPHGIAEAEKHDGAKDGRDPGHEHRQRPKPMPGRVTVGEAHHPIAWTSERADAPGGWGGIVQWGRFHGERLRRLSNRPGRVARSVPFPRVRGRRSPFDSYMA